MEKTLRKIALNVCGALYALWRIIRNLVGKTYRKLFPGSIERQTLKAIRKANELSAATKYKYYVLLMNGRVVIRPKRMIKNMLACKGKYFKRGTTIQDIERSALYITKN